MKPEQFKRMYEELEGAFPKHYATEGSEAIWSRKFAGKDGDIFRKVIDELTSKDEFPSAGYALRVYARIADSKNRSKYERRHNPIPAYIMRMSEAETEADYKLMTSFMAAYPFPGYPVGATEQECRRIDSDYHSIMRKNGINPDEATNPKVGQRLMADLVGTLPDLGRHGKPVKWEESLKNYKINLSRNDLKQAKRLAREEL